MIKSLSTIIMSTLLVFAVSAFAADTVVVIPLNTCSGGLTKCTEKCVDTDNNPFHCGGCGIACNDLTYCANGECTEPFSQTVGGVCSRTFECSADLTCSNGVCLKEAEDACTADNECVTGACEQHLCKIKVGETCAANSDCESAFCDSQICADTQWVFISSSDLTGNMGGISGADAICQGLADTAGLGGTYKAWLSDSLTSPSMWSNARDNPYLNVIGEKVADTWDDLTDGTLDRSMNIDEEGAQRGANVFTATNPDGSRNTGEWETMCADWTSSGGHPDNSYPGYSSSVNFTWTAAPTPMACDSDSQETAIYCIEQ